MVHATCLCLHVLVLNLGVCTSVCTSAAVQGSSLVEQLHCPHCRYLLHQGLASDLNQHRIAISRQ